MNTFFNREVDVLVTIRIGFRTHRIMSISIFFFSFKEFMKKSDVTKSGDLNMDEFLTYLQEHEKQLKLIFSSLDENKDGVISANEIVSAFQKLGIVITENEARALMQR